MHFSLRQFSSSVDAIVTTTTTPLILLGVVNRARPDSCNVRTLINLLHTHTHTRETIAQSEAESLAV